MTTSTPPRALLTVRQASAVLGVSERTMRRYIAEGVLPARRVGPKFVRLHPDDLEAFVERRIPTTISPQPR